MSGPPPPMENYKIKGFPSNTGPDPVKITQLPSQHCIQYWAIIGTPAKRIRWRADDGPLILVFGSFLFHQTEKKNIVKVGPPLKKNFLDLFLI